MSVAQFNREEMARSYAGRHLSTDPGLHYLQMVTEKLGKAQYA
jgi:hypothetical protein